MSRRPLLWVASILLLVALVVAFFNVPEVDILMRQVLRAVVPQRVQDAIRPLRAPMVVGFSPEWEATDVSLRSPVTVTFLTPMSTQATEQNVMIEPVVSGEFTWNGSTLIFTPSEDWPMDTVVTVSVGNDARSWLLRRMERGFAFRFTTLGPPAVVDTSPSQDVLYVRQTDGLGITFNRLMDRESVEERLSVTPRIPRQQLAWEGEELSITGALEPSTVYRISIGQGARDSAYGMVTEEDFEWSFVAVQHPPYVSISAVQNEVLVTAGRPSELELSLSNVSRIDADLYGLAVPTYVTMTHLSTEERRRFSPEQPALASWSIEPQITPDRDERRELDLDPLEPGLYYLSIDSPEGAADRAILISSSTALTMKRKPDQVLVWATSIGQGRPVADLPLAIYDAQAGLITTGVTDEAGLFQAQLDEPVDSVYVVAEKDGEVAICSDDWDQGIEPWRFEDVLWDWEASSDKYRALLYTDRAVYAPGQEVNFRGAFGVDEDGYYSQPEPGRVVNVTASNYRGDAIYQNELVIGPYGTVHDSFPLSEDAAEGEYLLTATVEGEQHQASFQIDRYGQEPLNVWWILDGEHYMAGDVISGTVATEYNFGVPVKGATVDYTVYATEYLEASEGVSGAQGTCESGSCWRYAEEIASGHGVTNEDGQFLLTLRADAGVEADTQRLILEATLTDDAGQQVKASTAVAVHGGEFRIDLLPERFALLTGERAAVNIQVTNFVGEPARDMDLFYDIQISEWEMVPSGAAEGGGSSWREITSEVGRSTITTDDGGQATIAFTPQQGGAYKVEAWGRDGRGRRVLGRTDLWVGDPDRRVAWLFFEHDRISLVADQESYDFDETARVLVQSPYERAMGLVTVEGAAILDHQVIMLDSNSAMLEIPLKKEYAPNVYVSVILVPQDVSGGAYPGFKVGYAELKVRSTDRQLRVELTPSRETYQPGQMAGLTIRTSDHLNRPVSAEVSLRVVGEGTFSSEDGKGSDVVNAFYGPRRLGVRTAESLSVHAARQRPADDYGGAGRMGEQKPQGTQSSIAYWNPAIVTDDSGVGQASFQMPERPVIWKAYATGITNAYQMGTAEIEIVVSQPLRLWAAAPSFLCAGDTAVIRAFVENDTGDPMPMHLRIDTTDGLSASQAVATITVEPGGRATVDWLVLAERAGVANFTVFASAGEEHSEVVQGTISILRFGEHGRVSAAYVVEGQGLQTVNVPGNAGPATLILDVAPSLSSALAGSVEYLMTREATSAEEIVSQFLPGLVLEQAAAAEGPWVGVPAIPGLPGLVESSLQRLYRLQNRDGGWGWVEGDQSQSYQTAYVVLGLNQARVAGYSVSERALQDGLEFLRKVSVETHDLNEKAYLSYVLSECGQGDLSLARSLSERRRNMDLYAQGYLSLALSNMGDDASARTIVNELVAAAVGTAHTAHWTEDEHDLSRMSSDGRTTSVVLQALSSIDPDHPLLTKAVNWLMWERDGGFWRSTYETSVMVSALSAYLPATGEGVDAAGYQIYLDDALVAESPAPRGGQAAYREQITAQLSSGEHIIEAVSLGKAPLYLSTVVEYYALRELVGAARSVDGPSVERMYEVVSTGEPANQSGLGDLLRVRLRVEAREDVWYAILEDPLPSGTELVASNPPTSFGGAAQTGTLAHAVSLGDRIAFFATWLPAGNHEFTYLVRAATPGEFKVMPAEMRAVYEPGVWGRSASSSLKVIGRP